MDEVWMRSDRIWELRAEACDVSMALFTLVCPFNYHNCRDNHIRMPVGVQLPLDLVSSKNEWQSNRFYTKKSAPATLVLVYMRYIAT